MDFGLIDADGHWCPVCGEMRGICQCDESDFMAEEADDWYEDDYEPEGARCGCPFCYCTNVTIAGEKCNQCLAGIHQG